MITDGEVMASLTLGWIMDIMAVMDIMVVVDTTTLGDLIGEETDICMDGVVLDTDTDTDGEIVITAHIITTTDITAITEETHMLTTIPDVAPITIQLQETTTEQQLNVLI